MRRAWQLLPGRIAFGGALMIASSAWADGQPTAATAAERGLLEQRMVIYSEPPAQKSRASERLQAEQQYRIDRLLSGAFGKPDDFVARARVAFRTHRRMTVEETIPLELAKGAAAPPGWNVEGRRFSWQAAPGQARAWLTVPVLARSEQGAVQVSDYDEVWFDYYGGQGIGSCAPQVEMSLAVSNPATGKSEEILVRAGAASPLRPQSTLEMSDPRWSPKDLAYLARRELGFAPDSDWRYSQENNNAVLQRRLHERLDNVEVIELGLASGVQIEQINLRVSQRDSSRPGQIIEFPGLLNMPSLPDDKPGLRVRIQESLRKQFPKEFVQNAEKPGSHSFYLQEIVIFVPGDVDRFIASQPIRHVTFMVPESGAAASADIAVQNTLSSSVINVGPQLNRLVVDLRSLADRGDTVLKRSLLRLAPAGADTPCAIQAEGMQLVRTYSRKTPSFAVFPEAWSRRQGGLFRVLTPKPGEIEAPGIVAHLPFCMLTLAEGRQDDAEYSFRLRGSTGQVEVVPRQGAAIPYWIAGPGRTRINPDRARLHSSAGATLTAEGPLPRVTREGNLLVLEGRSDSLELSWPVNAALPAETWVALAIPEGAEQVSGALLTLEFGDGTVTRQRVVPGRGQRVASRSAVLRQVRLRIVPAANPFRLKLFELSLFAPKSATYGEAFFMAQPEPYTVKPMPVMGGSYDAPLSLQPGSVSGITSERAGTAVRFSTRIDPALQWVRGIHLKYRIPRAIGESCALSLVFNWTQGRMERDLCLEKSEGTLFVPIANLLGASDKPANLGILTSIDWTFHAHQSNAAITLELFEFEFAIEGWTAVSAMEQLRLTPLMHIGKTPWHLPDEAIAEIRATNLLEGFWVTLDADALSRIISRGGGIQGTGSVWFTLDRIVVEPKRRLGDREWRELSTPKFSGRPRPRPYWPLAVLIVFAGWFAARKAWWSPAKTGHLLARSAHAAARMAVVVAAAGARFVARWSSQLNLLIALTALGPGVWVAGRMGLTTPGTLLFVSCLLVAWAAHRHWRERQRRAATGDNAAIGTPLFITGIAVALAVWAASNLHGTPHAVWALAPLVAALYILVPSLVSAGIARRIFASGKKLLSEYSRHVWLAAWLTVAAILYSVGSLSRRAEGENLFFTFAAISLMLAIRSALLVLEPPVRRLLPSVANKVYAGAGGLYLSGALVVMCAMAIALALGLQVISEQLGIVLYFFLIVGTAQAVIALGRTAPSERPTS